MFYIKKRVKIKVFNKNLLKWSIVWYLIKHTFYIAFYFRVTLRVKLKDSLKQCHTGILFFFFSGYVCKSQVKKKKSKKLHRWNNGESGQMFYYYLSSYSYRELVVFGRMCLWDHMSANGSKCCQLNDFIIRFGDFLNPLATLFQKRV